MSEIPDAAHALYAEPPEGFVASRNALAKELRAQGDDAAAAVVAKLRRPTVAAAAVNRAVREHEGPVDQLLDAGRRLAAAQRRALSGGRGAADELRAAGDERRTLVRQLADAAVSLAANDGRPVDHLRDEIAGTFEAATLDDELGDRLRAGTVERSVTPSAGLEGLEGFAVLQGSGGDEPAEADEEPPPDPAARAERAAAEAAAEALTARSEAERAAKAADRAGQRADRLARAAEDAERDARDARAEERRLRDEAATARRRAERAERAAKAAAHRAGRRKGSRRT